MLDAEESLSEEVSAKDTGLLTCTSETDWAAGFLRGLVAGETVLCFLLFSSITRIGVVYVLGACSHGCRVYVTVGIKLCRSCIVAISKI